MADSGARGLLGGKDHSIEIDRKVTIFYGPWNRTPLAI